MQKIGPRQIKFRINRSRSQSVCRSRSQSVRRIISVRSRRVKSVLLNRVKSKSNPRRNVRRLLIRQCRIASLQSRRRSEKMRRRHSKIRIKISRNTRVKESVRSINSLAESNRRSRMLQSGRGSLVVHVRINVQNGTQTPKRRRHRNHLRDRRPLLRPRLRRLSPRRPTQLRRLRNQMRRRHNQFLCRQERWLLRLRRVKSCQLQ